MSGTWPGLVLRANKHVEACTEDRCRRLYSQMSATQRRVTEPAGRSDQQQYEYGHTVYGHGVRPMGLLGVITVRDELAKAPGLRVEVDNRDYTDVAVEASEKDGYVKAFRWEGYPLPPSQVKAENGAVKLVEPLQHVTVEGTVILTWDEQTATEASKAESECQ